MSDQIPFGAITFAENPEPRVPCVLLLDTSGSMLGAPITQLNAGLQAYREELSADPLAAKRVEIALITFGGKVTLVSDFTGVEGFYPPPLAADGATPLGEAVNLALDKLEERKRSYREHGIAYYRPWLFLVTDGAPTDDWSRAASRVAEGEGKKSLCFFAVGVQGAQMDLLQKLSVRTPLRLEGLKFREMFQWLSNSQSSVSRSSPTEEVPLTNPTAPSGWASV